MAGLKPLRRLGQTAGLARILSESPVSDGSTALEIHGFHLHETGVLDGTFRLMPLIPDEWRGAAQPEPFTRGVLGMCFARFGKGEPELLVLTPGAATGGVWQYAPWGRATGGTHPGLEQARMYADGGAAAADGPSPGSPARLPPSFVRNGDRIYFTFGDGGPAWVWSRIEVRPLGYTQAPSAPQAEGPARLQGTATSPNSGGFSVRGRVGTTEGSWTATTGETVGGVDNFVRRYYAVWENVDGAYSPTSPEGGMVQMQLQLADPADTETFDEHLRRRFRVKDIPHGPPGTAACVLLATPNLIRAADSAPRFLHRIPNNETSEYIDDIPDGELGPVWQDRAAAFSAPQVIHHHGGSLWLFQGADAQWSEQEVPRPVAESFMKGHRMTLFPATGDVTAAHTCQFRTTTAATIMLVLKAGACHYVTGNYPLWEKGTLHDRAGCDGPQLIQALPDGSSMWYGNGCMWMLGTDGSVDDVSAPIRSRLNRVNRNRAKFGCSWVDPVNGEAVFALPTDDNTLNNMQFIWDYRVQGWRTREDVKIRAAVTVGRYVLLAGVYGLEDTVWVYKHGYPTYAVTHPTVRYTSGWRPMADAGPDLHTSATADTVIFLLEERASSTADVTAYIDWDLDTAISDDTMPLKHPENGTTTVPVAVYAASANDVGGATYGTSVWRTARTVQSRVPMQVPYFSVVAFSVEAAGPVALISADFYGSVVAEAGAFTPQQGA